MEMIYVVLFIQNNKEKDAIRSQIMFIFIQMCMYVLYSLVYTIDLCKQQTIIDTINNSIQ